MWASCSGFHSLSPLLNHCRSTRRFLNTSAARHMMTLWEPDRKGGWQTVEQQNKPWYDELIPDPIYPKELWQFYRDETKKWWHEVKMHFRQDNWEYLIHGDCKMVYDFADKSTCENFILTTDADYGQGRSSAQFLYTQRHTGLFKGIIDTDPVKDGVTKYAGYANVHSPYLMKSFGREMRHTWDEYSHIIMKIRGDGRNYMLNLNTPGEFDISWADMYCYPIWTRGGPYWQIVRIPFSKFFLGHKGRIQDKQVPLPKNRVNSLSITCGDAINGPFHLEIEWIMVEYDETHHEEFAYELYEGRPFEN